MTQSNRYCKELVGNFNKKREKQLNIMKKEKSLAKAVWEYYIRLLQ